MCNYVLFWISYLLSALQWIWILKRFFVTHGLGPGKPGARAAKPITPPNVENNYRIEVKITFMLIAYLVLLCEFFWEFSIFQFCRPLVDIYWHPLLSVHLKTTPKTHGPSAKSQKFGFIVHSRGTAETCHILIFDY